MASRRSHAPTNNQQIEYELRVPGTMLHITVPRSGTYIMKPTASCEAAQLWVRAILPPHIVPRRGTDASRMMLRMIVGHASRNQERVGRIVYPTAALLRSLQWVSDRYVSLQDTALIGVLLLEAAWLRRDAIASYVCLVCCINSCLSVRYITKKNGPALAWLNA